jgi:hypothetical protein
MIAIIRRSKAPRNAPNPTSNISVNTWATPKVVSGVFFGCPASVRPITFSIAIGFLFLDEPTSVTMTTNNRAVKDCDGLPPLFTNCLEEAFSETERV